MKTIEEMEMARAKIIFILHELKPSEQQKVLLKGMSVALQWVCDDGGSTLQDILDGKEICEGGK